MAANYDDALAQLREAGLLVDGLTIGRLQRCKTEDGGREKRGWYHLHEIRLDSGEDAIVGAYGVWRGNENNAQRIKLTHVKLTPEQRAAMKQRLKADREQAQRMRQAAAKRAADRAAKTWRNLAVSGESAYLKRKGVAAHGVRFSARGGMAIPMCDTVGTVHGLQVIRDRQRGGNVLEKQFWPAGVSPTGRFHLLGVPSDIILVAEGYATAASLHEATGLPVAVAFTAGNLLPVAQVLRKRYARARLLLCADDDDTQKCRQCKERVWVSDGPTCPHCGAEHGASNAGVSAASTAALAVHGEWMAPAWASADARKAQWLEHGRKLNDFNDLHLLEGLPVVRAQVESRLLALGWRSKAPTRANSAAQGEGGAPLRPVETLDELLERFALVYGHDGGVFDHQEHCIVTMTDMRNLCVPRELHRSWADDPDKQVVRMSEVDFDPSETDESVICNLWGGWPTQAVPGECSQQLELLYHMCKGDSRPEDLYQWVLRWLAYPLQHPGAKMKTTLVIHGPQGTGKNLFFESIMAMYGPYGRVIDQSAIDDKFNDWASRKLFLVADEVVAQADRYQVKNKLKSFITGEWIRINPKGLAARDERNHVNMVFLSNEIMPVVLEEDDRRHAVLWTPGKLDQGFYRGVLMELEDGGVAALHHYLLNLDLGDFGPGTLPPMTDAKRALIDLSKDSPSQFVQAFEMGDIEGFPARNAPALMLPCLSSDLYELYRHWCAENNLRALHHPRFTSSLMRRHGAVVERKRYTSGAGARGPSAVVYMTGGRELPPGENESHWLGERILDFRDAMKARRGGEFGQ